MEDGGGEWCGVETEYELCYDERTAASAVSTGEAKGQNGFKENG